MVINPWALVALFSIIMYIIPTVLFVLLIVYYKNVKIRVILITLIVLSLLFPFLIRKISHLKRLKSGDRKNRLKSVDKNNIETIKLENNKNKVKVI